MTNQRLISSLFMLLSVSYKSFGFVPSPSLTARKTTTPMMLSISNNEQEVEQHNDLSIIPTHSSRRNFVAASSLLLSTLSTTTTNPANAADLNPYTDPEYNFQISLPTNWIKSEQQLSDRRKIVFFVDNEAKEGEDKTLVFIAYTPLRDDFTSLSSFGSVDQVAQAQILPKGQVGLMDETESKMLSAESKKNAYYFDYTIKVPEQPKRHFRTIFDLKQPSSGSAGAVLVSITAQTTSDKYNGGLQSLFDEIISSYGKIPK